MDGRALLVVALAAATGVMPLRAQTAVAPLTLADAQRMIAAARQKAIDANVKIAIAVVDGRGDLIALERMPGAYSLPVADVVLGKATVSAIFGQPSAEVAMSQFGENPGCGPIFCDPPPTIYPLFNDMMGGKFRFIRGAVPVIRGGRVVGAIATGGAGPLDPELAMVGLAVATK